MVNEIWGKKLDVVGSHLATIKELRLEIIRLETEVGDLCKRNQRLESELKLLRGGDHAD